MALNRVEVLTSYLRDLVIQFISLQDEKTQMQNAAARIIEINGLIADLQTDAQAALDRLNTLQGTTFTLQDIKKRYQPLGAI
jgi:hypothetical protein